MVFPNNHVDKDLRGKPKGMRAVVKERSGVWAKLLERHGSKKAIVGKCKNCSMSQVKKDALRRLQKAEEMDNPDGIGVEDIQADDIDVMVDTDKQAVDEWCCLHRVLSLQDDFKNEKPMIWHYLTGRGHKCIFYPKFHCELNAIEMLWGYAKYRECFTFPLVSAAHSFVQAIAALRTANSRQPKHLYLSAWTWPTITQSGGSFARVGAIWMLIGELLCSDSTLWSQIELIRQDWGWMLHRQLGQLGSTSHTGG
jgi:hypothetical protein